MRMTVCDARSAVVVQGPLDLLGDPGRCQGVGAEQRVRDEHVRTVGPAEQRGAPGGKGLIWRSAERWRSEGR